MKKSIPIVLGILVLLPVVFYVDPAGSAPSESPSNKAPVLEALAGTLFLVAFVTSIACAASLWFHLDTSLPEARGGAIAVLRSLRWTLPLPPERLLTPTGQKRARFAKAAVVIAATCAAFLVIRSASRA